ncbi:hypothetical protein DES53_10475 [Roseimicrobium gellanilyticum]|uniref:HNH endonuclease n=1 Tax=Roseimicrobium gellanilyticum TaxID=748857 RepID=A0A366HNA1_9BACT|nr:hypothetical protein [Roseimicrobium gellanilyticum]RBP44256.1 hypothetical protein DES53_10475 [Roseimicrobium gellanilyticum]
MEPSITHTTAIATIARLTNPEKLSRLRASRAANGRMNRCMYWLHMVETIGGDVPAIVDQALAARPERPGERRLTKHSLLRNYKRMRMHGAFTPENLTRLQQGHAAVASRWKYQGQTLEVDHVIPVRLAPELSAKIANLAYLPRLANRRKADRVARAAVTLLRFYHKQDIVSKETLEHAQILQAGGKATRLAPMPLPTAGVSVRSGAPIPAGDKAYAAPSIGAQAIDPRRLIVGMSSIVESLQDWEPRADAAISTAESTLNRTAEHIDRGRHRLVVAQSRHRDDEVTIGRLEADLSSWKTRVVHSLELVNQCLADAQKARSRADAAVTLWSNELEEARTWLATAREREEHARDEVDRAERALSEAESELSHAEAELSSARSETVCVGTDKDGRGIYRAVDTGPYEEAVRQAWRQVQNCRDWLSRAEHELSVAIADREAAQERVRVCERALELAQGAAQSASAAWDTTLDAQARIQRAEEDHQHASYLASTARQELAGQHTAVSAMGSFIRAADTRQAEAAEACREAHRHHSVSRQKSTQGGLEIQWRSEQLKAFDAPISGL